jgi:hypothetical protein
MYKADTIINKFREETKENDHILFPNLCVLGITCLLHLKLLLLGKTNTEHPQEVAICGLDVHISLDQRLPFFDHGAQLVSGQVHSMEVGQDITTLDFLGHQFEFPEGHLVILKISQWDFKHSSFQAIRSDFCEYK